MEWFNPVLTTVAMVVWGMVVKYWPALAKVPNNLISIMNVLIGFLVKLVSPEPAHAGLTEVAGTAANALGWAMPLLQAIAARQVHETFLRPLFLLFGIKRAG